MVIFCSKCGLTGGWHKMDCPARKRDEPQSDAEKLADILEAYPGAHIEIDNDYWAISTDGSYDNEIAHSDDFRGAKAEWWSDQNLYGALVADALIILLNRRGFNLKARAV